MPRANKNAKDTVLGILTRDNSSRRRLVKLSQDQQQQPTPPSSPQQQQQQQQQQHHQTSTISGGTTPTSPPFVHKKFSFLYALLNPRSRQWQALLFKRVISMVILADLISFILSTEPALMDYLKLFETIEGISCSVFLLEYLARLCVCVERPRYQEKGPIWGRASAALSTAMIIDAISTLPYFMNPFVPAYHLPRLTYLRFLRLLRIAKTNGAMQATGAVYRVIYYNSEILYVASYTCTLLVLGTGVILYFLRPPDLNPLSEGDSAEQFDSILSTMYLSAMMLTGQGGPDGDLPWYTKVVVLLTSIVSVAMFAIPASMLTWGFEAEAARMAKRAYARSKRERDGCLVIDSSDDDYSTDEEYQKIIAGEEAGEDEGDDDDDPWRKELLERFAKADEDGSGHISLKEFIALSSAPTAASSAGGGTGEGPALAMVMGRVQALEREQKANSAKLDQILQLLESKKSR